MSISLNDHERRIKALENGSSSQFDFKLKKLIDTKNFNELKSIQLPTGFNNLFVCSQTNDVNEDMNNGNFVIYTTSFYPRILLEQGFQFRLQDDQGGDIWDYITWKYDKATNRLNVVNSSINNRIIIYWN